MLYSRLKMIRLYFAEGLQRTYCRTTWALTTQGIWRKAEPWLVCVTILQVGTDNTRSERSAGKGLTSREATGRPTAADTNTQRWMRIKKSHFNNIIPLLGYPADLLESLVFGSKLFQLFNLLQHRSIDVKGYLNRQCKESQLITCEISRKTISLMLTYVLLALRSCLKYWSISYYFRLKQVNSTSHLQYNSCRINGVSWISFVEFKVDFTPHVQCYRHTTPSCFETGPSWSSLISP